MSIVLKLQKKCLDNNQDLQSLLREAYVISRKLKLKDFETWINSELKGYTSNIPDYREVQTTLKFFDTYHGWTQAIINDSKLAKILSYQKIAQPIGEIVNLLNTTNSDNALQINLSPKNMSMLMKQFTTDCQPAQFIDRTQMFGITEQVRNLLLEWTLKLEEDNILGTEDLVFSEKEKEAAKSIHIENFHGVMGDIAKVGNISSGDNSINTYNENNINDKIDQLIQEVKVLKPQDEQVIIKDLEASKNNPDKAKTVLGGLLSRGAELGSIGSLVIGILGLL